MKPISVETVKQDDRTLFTLSVAEDAWLVAAIDHTGSEKYTPGNWSRCVAQAPGPIAYIDELWVVPAKRGSGLGSVLLKKFLGLMRDRGVAWVFTYALPFRGGGSLKDLVGFLRHHGFVEAPECDDKDAGDRGVLLKTTLTRKSQKS